MEVQIDKPASYLRKMSVTVPVGDVDAAFEKVYRDIGKSANIPGFRPGKAPKSLIEAHYGSQVKNEVQQRLVTDTLFKAIDEVKENPVHMPKVEPGEVARGKAFAYTAEFEVQPEVHLSQYKGLVAPAAKIEVADADLDKQLEELRKQSSQLVPVMLRDIAQHGDVLVIDYEGTMGGSPIPGGRGENALIELGGETYLPGLAEGLVGVKVPSERSVPVTFPPDFSNTELAGKDATFDVKVKELKTRELPRLDDEFAKDLGEESLAALRERMKNDAKARKEQEATSERRMTLLKALVAANPFELPPSLITNQTDRNIASAAARVEQMMGRRMQLSADEVANLRQEGRADAEFQVRSGILLLEVAKKESIEVAPQEVEAEIERMVEASGENAERMRHFFNDPQQRESLRFKLLEERTIKFLFEHAIDS